MVPVIIPTNQSFLQTWNAWIYSKVSSEFKRDHDRIPDTVQNIRLRLLSKDFIGRWFFKHLKEELVTKDEAQFVLGGLKIEFISSIPVFDGKRSSSSSLWKVSDICKFANFDFESYFYRVQNHTIDSDKFLKLLGYPPGSYSTLQSMWRQGKLSPSEFTEHLCDKSSTCEDCVKGRKKLNQKKMTLSSDWMSPELSQHVSKLRWNDSQLTPFLRNWHGRNRIFNTPRNIMRDNVEPGVTAGLLAYAKMIIKNEVVNDFKRMMRFEDVSTFSLSDSKSPEFSNSETISYGSDLKNEKVDHSIINIHDPSSVKEYEKYDSWHDIMELAKNSGLSKESLWVIGFLEYGDGSIDQCASKLGRTYSDICNIRQDAINRLKKSEVDHTMYDDVVLSASKQFKIDSNIIFGPKMAMFGNAVLARTSIVSTLYKRGVSISTISQKFHINENYVVAALSRAKIIRTYERSNELA